MKSPSDTQRFVQKLSGEAQAILARLDHREFDFRSACLEEFAEFVRAAQPEKGTEEMELLYVFVYELMRRSDRPVRGQLRATSSNDLVPRFFELLDHMRETEAFRHRRPSASLLAGEAETLLKHGRPSRAHAVQDETHAQLNQEFRQRSVSERGYFEQYRQFQHQMAAQQPPGTRFIECSAIEWLCGQVYSTSRQLMSRTRCLVLTSAVEFKVLVADLATGFDAMLPLAYALRHSAPGSHVWMDLPRRWLHTTSS